MELLKNLMLYASLFAAGFLAASYMFRRHFLKQKAITKEYERKLIGMIYSIHHDGFNPRLKRIRGCINACRTHFDSMVTLEEFALRPNHQNYVSLLMKELKEVREWFNRICSVCIEMEKDIMDNAKKYE